MLDKLEHVFRELDLKKAIKAGDKVMIKTHFGLYGNTNHIRSAYVRKLVDLVKEAGGFTFIADTCSLAYGTEGPYGGRTTQPEYLMRAAMNGFTEGTLGAPIVIIQILGSGYLSCSDKWGPYPFSSCCRCYPKL